MSTHVYMYSVFKNAVAGLGDMSLVVCLRIYICTMFSKLQSQCWVICHYHGACVYASYICTMFSKMQSQCWVICH